MEEINVPSFFLCPISMEIMKDPVTVSSGITYDRESIEKWLFSNKKNNTCPVTRQPLNDCDLTPNHTLRRLIQSWCTLNASHGIERFPTPRPLINKAQIQKLIKDAVAATDSSYHYKQINCLRKLRSIASENDTNKRYMEAAGAVDFLASIVTRSSSSLLNQDISYLDEHEALPVHEALSLLHNLQISETGIKNLTAKNNGEFILSLTRVMQTGNYESRTYAMMLIKTILEVADPMILIGLKPELFKEIVQCLNDQMSQKASKAALRLLVSICPWGRNKYKAVEAGVVSTLIDLLLDNPEKRECEMMLTVLDMLCRCAEGRAEFLKHGAGMAIVSKKILRISQAASEKAMKILFSMAKYCATQSVLHEMLVLGVVAKMCLVLQVDCGSKIKEKARDVLKLHARVWKNSPCFPLNLFSIYPNND